MQLIITEKPGVAKAIAGALNIRDKEKHDGYIEGDGRIVSWCLGHLVELSEPEDYDKAYKRWSYESLPIIPEKWTYRIKPETAKQFGILKSLMERPDVTELVEATDAGREGENIFRLAYRMAGCHKPFRRLWISSMEESAIRRGFEELKPGEEYDSLYESARCRQEADWLVGINGTRLFSVLYGKKLKVGRVQTPTLAMLADREAEISGFRKKPYFLVHIGTEGLDAVSEKIPEKEKAEDLMRACEGGSAAVVKAEREDKTEAPPRLYDLTALQRDANRIFGFTAKQTLDYAQSLYEKKLLTYPRTDSRYLSDDMAQTAEEVLKAVSQEYDFAGSVACPDIGKILDSSKVTDHHALIPTVEIGRADFSAVPEGEKKILSLAALRLACAASKNHCYTRARAVLSCNGHEFTASGKTVTEKGWKAIEEEYRKYYGIGKEEDPDHPPLPDLQEGQVLHGLHSKVTEHSTQPPKRYTEDTLLRTMEKAGSAETTEEAERKGLGTPATRADIIEKLVKDGYVKRDKKNMIPTEEGMKLITILPDTVKSAKLTAEWENSLTKVARGEMKGEEFMDGIRKMVRELVGTYHEFSDSDAPGCRGEILGKCPKCGADVRTGKYGAYCTKRCGMALGKAMGKKLTEEEAKSLLEGKKTLVKGLKKKDGGTYDAYLTPAGISPYCFTDKDGQEQAGFRLDYNLDFPGKK